MSVKQLEDEFNIDDSLATIQQDSTIETSTKETIENAVSTIHSTELQLSEIKDQKFNIADRKYLADQLQALIDTNMTVLTNLAPLCRVGSPPAIFMSFTQISNTITSNLKELFNLNKQITDYQITETNMKIKQSNIERKLKTPNIAPQSATNIQNNYVMSQPDIVNQMKEDGVEHVKYSLPDFKFGN